VPRQRSSSTSGGLVDQTTFFFVTSWVFSLSTAGLIVAWRGSRARARRAEAQLVELLRTPDGTRPDQQLLSEIDALRIEIERLAEGQRFVARVLAERTPSSDL